METLLRDEGGLTLLKTELRDGNGALLICKFVVKHSQHRMPKQDQIFETEAEAIAHFETELSQSRS